MGWILVDIVVVFVYLLGLSCCFDVNSNDFDFFVGCFGVWCVYIGGCIYLLCLVFMCFGNIGKYIGVCSDILFGLR